MDASRFDALTRSLAQRVGRRRLFRAGAAGGVAIGTARSLLQRTLAQDSGTVGLPCEPCNCTESGCDCCIIGITGGGVVRTQAGDVNLVINTVGSDPTAVRDSASIRRTALLRGLPYFTTVAAARAGAGAIRALQNESIGVRSLQEIHPRT